MRNKNAIQLIKLILAIVIATGSFKISLLVANPIEMLKGSGIGGIILLPFSFIIFLSLVSFIGFGSWYYIIRLLDQRGWLNGEILDSDDTRGNKKGYSIKKYKMSFSKVLLKVLIGTIIMIAVFIALMTIQLSNLRNKADKRYDETFLTKYPAINFNDNRIIFYKSELDKSSNDFVKSSDEYQIFKADVKREIALECIKFFQDEYRNNEHLYSYKQMGYFKKNSRNRYANNTERIKKTKENEKTLSDNPDIYRYYAKSYSIKQVLKDQFLNSCSDLVEVENLYEQYIPLYIAKKETKLKKYQEFIKSNNKNGYGYGYRHEKQVKWLEELHHQYPKNTSLKF